jgi:hypothetical protein
MGVRFFMQKVISFFIYYENRTMSYKINLIAWRHNHQALIMTTTVYSHLLLDKHQHFILEVFYRIEIRQLWQMPNDLKFMCQQPLFDVLRRGFRVVVLFENDIFLF